MKIGLIAMSGVRVQDAELMKLGLTLPGFVERSEVIASLPSLSLLTLAEYVSNNEVTQRYQTPGILWLSIPVMMFWTYRAWMWANRGKIGDDPVIFAMKDQISRLTGLVILAIFLLARYLNVDWMAL